MAAIWNRVRFSLLSGRLLTKWRGCEMQYKSTYNEVEAVSKSRNDRHSGVTLTDDGNTIVCWHPEIGFPYEHTKPIPVEEPEFREEDSVLKVQYRKLAKEYGKVLIRPDLQKITTTTKHQWFPKPEKRYRKPNPVKDRDGI